MTSLGERSARAGGRRQPVAGGTERRGEQRQLALVTIRDVEE